MECASYAEQIYQLKERIVRARVLSAQEAEVFGYEDGYTAQKPKGKLCVDSFNSETAVKYHLEGLTDCRTMN